MRFDRLLRQSLALVASVSMAMVCTPVPLYAADKNIDLDGSSTNGNESNAALNVVTTYPTKIKDKVTSKAVGQAFRFSWAGAGPGGFFSSVPLGTSGGVGAMWTWDTTQQVFSINSDITFNQTAPGTVQRTFTGLPGRSLTSSGVTTSAASLTSSLITFFSPPIEKVRVKSTVIPVAGGVFQYVTEVTNFSTAPINFDWAPGPLDCDSESCGNGEREGSEECDGSDLDGATCEIFGGSGTLQCTEGCEFDISSCSGVCGNGAIDDKGEQCDGSNLDEQSCESLGYAGGTLGCSAEDCTFDVSGCTSAVCGNGEIEPGEVCDGSNLGGQTCFSQGFECGSLACQEGCTAFDTTGCSNLCFAGSANGASANAAKPAPSAAPPASGSLLSRGAPVSLASRTSTTRTSSLSSTARTPSGSNPIRRIGPRRSTLTAPVGEGPCDFDGRSGRLDPGETSKHCEIHNVPAKEVTSQIVVCGDDLPSGPQGCGTSADSGTQGTANVLVPDFATNVPSNVFLSPYHVAVQDGANGFADPGETFNLFITLINTGSADLTDVTATLSIPSQDIDGDGTPEAPIVQTATAAYPTIPGLAVGVADCDSPAAALHPVTNLTPFVVTLPAGFPPDTNLKLELSVTGTPVVPGVQAGVTQTQDLVAVLGVGGPCTLSNLDGSYTKVDGFLSPMGALVPKGDPFPDPDQSLSNRTRPLKVRLFCGDTNLDAGDIAAPEIVALTRDGVPIDVSKVDLNDSANNHGLFFRYSSGFWIYNMRTRLLGHGTFVITIRFANGQEYQSQFFL